MAKSPLQMPLTLRATPLSGPPDRGFYSRSDGK